MIYVLLAGMGLSFGALISAGVFTVLLATGMITRFAGKMALAKHIRLFENTVILGTVLGSFSLMFDLSFRGGWMGILLLAVYGVFAGMFVGCLAMTIAEILDSIPIFSRRAGFRKGLEWATVSIAFGKIAGSLLYFVKHMEK